MAVKPKSKVQRKRVKALTDPKPEFVSLVMAGANMTPFTALKADGVDAPVAKSDTHEIVHLVFAKADYADVAAVKAWLAEGGYPEDTEVAEREDDFTVGELVPGASAVQHGTVTVYLAEREQPEVKAEPVVSADTSPTAVTEVQPVAKADDVPVEAPVEAVVEAVVEATPVVTKYDEMSAMFSDDTDFAGVLADGFDGLPPAIYEVTSALYTAVRNCALAGDLAGIAAASAAYGEMVAKLCALFPPESEDDAEEKAARTAAFDKHTATLGVAPVEAVKVDDVPVAEVAEVAEVAAAPVESVVSVELAATDTVATDTVTADVISDDAPVIIEEVEAVVVAAEAAPDLSAIVATLAKSVQELTDTVSRLHNEAAAKSDDLVGRVTAIEGERQSRRGADDDEAPAVIQPERTKGLGDISLRAALGIQRKAS